MLFWKKKKKVVLAEITAEQEVKLNEFKVGHADRCKMTNYQIVIAHRDGSNDRLFLRCPVCGNGCEI